MLCQCSVTVIMFLQQCVDITKEWKSNGNGWDSSRGVEVFGRRRDRHAVGSDARDIRARENTNGVER